LKPARSSARNIEIKIRSHLVIDPAKDRIESVLAKRFRTAIFGPDAYSVSGNSVRCDGRLTKLKADQVVLRGGKSRVIGP